MSQCGRLRYVVILYALMLDRYLTLEHAARDLVSMHGRRARQVVVDEIVQAIRDSDMESAKAWDRVGQAVDKLILGDPTGPDIS